MYILSFSAEEWHFFCSSSFYDEGDDGKSIGDGVRNLDRSESILILINFKFKLLLLQLMFLVSFRNLGKVACLVGASRFR